MQSFRPLTHPLGRQPSPSTVWLDFLPRDLCDQIALTVCDGRQTVDALNLALSTPSQALSVLRALSFSLALPAAPRRNHPRAPSSSPDHRKWTRLFAPHVQKLYIHNTATPHASLRELLAAPTLRTLVMPAHSRLLCELSALTSVRDLSLAFLPRLTPARFGHLSFPLSVRTLSLSCFFNSEPKLCPFQQETCLCNTDNFFANAFLAVSRLSVFCNCSESASTVWKFVAIFRNLTSVCTNQVAPISILPSLRIADIRFTEIVCDGFDTIVKLGKCVTQVKMKWFGPPVTSEQLVSLAACQNLRSLMLGISTGVDAQVASLLRHFPELKELCLLWKREVGDRGWECIDATPGVVLDAVRSSPTLRKLDLKRVIISLDELKDILQVLGMRLERFGIDIISWGDSVLTSLSGVLDFLIEFNPEVLNFDIGDSHLIWRSTGELCSLQELQEQMLDVRFKLRKLGLLSKTANRGLKLDRVYQTVETFFISRRASLRALNC